MGKLNYLPISPVFRLSSNKELKFSRDGVSLKDRQRNLIEKLKSIILTGSRV